MFTLILSELHPCSSLLMTFIISCKTKHASFKSSVFSSFVSPRNSILMLNYGSLTLPPSSLLFWIVYSTGQTVALPVNVYAIFLWRIISSKVDFPDDICPTKIIRGIELSMFSVLHRDYKDVISFTFFKNSLRSSRFFPPIIIIYMNLFLSYLYIRLNSDRNKRMNSELNLILIY